MIEFLRNLGETYDLAQSIVSFTVYWFIMTFFECTRRHADPDSRLISLILYVGTLIIVCLLSTIAILLFGFEWNQETKRDLIITALVSIPVCFFLTRSKSKNQTSEEEFGD